MGLWSHRTSGAIARTCLVCAATAGLIVTLAGCQAKPTSFERSTITNGDGAVVGGIDACYALPILRPQQDRGLVAGTVIVYRGAMRFHTAADGVITTVYPVDQVTSVEIAHYQQYRFTLLPGTYVLLARHPAGSPALEWVQVVVHAGTVTKQNIPTGAGDADLDTFAGDCETQGRGAGTGYPLPQAHGGEVAGTSARRPGIGVPFVARPQPALPGWTSKFVGD
ncbi:MAG: hypothetical protein M0027_11425 [Candidatus Dormibacteraeota bacterium]|nr:hypothetical protein [Candidatus Dormibacteraeota bacterium]